MGEPPSAEERGVIIPSLPKLSTNDELRLEDLRPVLEPPEDLRLGFTRGTEPDAIVVAYGEEDPLAGTTSDIDSAAPSWEAHPVLAGGVSSSVDEELL